MAESEKKILVILPGWGGSQETWKDFQEYIQADFASVLVIDLPCFGSEPCPADVWGVEEYAAFVEKKLKGIGSPDSLILLGHSFGGQVATYLVGTKQNVCNKLILVGAAVFRQRRSAKHFAFYLVAKAGKFFFKLPGFQLIQRQAKKILYRLANAPDYLQTSGVQREIFQKVVRQDVSDLARKISVPTALIWGDRDTYVPLRQGKKLRSYIPQAKFAIIHGGKHGLHHTHKDELRKQILSFVYPNTYAF